MILSDDEKYLLLKNRDPKAEGMFFYAVHTTKIFCRPTCSARLPMRKNISFYDTREEAIANKFRPCKRCKPDQEDGWNKARELVLKACLIIRNDARRGVSLDVENLMSVLKVSKWHFYRTFRNYTKMTPRKFYLKCAQGLEMDMLKRLPAVETKKNLQKLKAIEREDLSKAAKSIPTPPEAENFDPTLMKNDYMPPEFTIHFEDIFPDLHYHDFIGFEEELFGNRM